MEIELKRDVVQRDHRTYGKVYLDGVLACESMEPFVREIEGVPVSSWVVPGDTAVPRGRYRVIINRSKESARNLPALLNVPGLDDVRIGFDTLPLDNWIFVGISRSDSGLTYSREAFNELFEDIREALNLGEQVWITVR